MKAWLDGSFLPPDEITVPVLSHTVGRGSAIFEVLELVATGKGPAIFRLDAHVERFFGSAERTHMRLPVSKDELRAAAVETARQSGLRSGAIKFMAYYSHIEFGLFPRDPAVSVAVFCASFSEAVGKSREELRQPVTAGVSSVRKLSEKGADVHAKVAGNYVNAFLAKWEIVQKGWQEAILLDEAGRVAEGALCNLFLVKGGAVRTAPVRKVLAGITRSSVIEVVKELALPFEEAESTLQDLQEAEEAFFTGTLIRVLPIREIDGRELGAGHPGPVSRSVQSALNVAYEEEDPRQRKWLTLL